MKEDTTTFPKSLRQAFNDAVTLLHASEAAEAVDALQALQPRVARANLFSANESLEDVATSSLPLLLVEHYLALGLTQVSTMGPNMASLRYENLQVAAVLWSAFLRRLEKLELLSTAQLQEVHILEELSEATSYSDTGNGSNNSAQLLNPPTTHRDAKIARHRLQQAAQQQQAKLQALVDRRRRLGLASTENLDGHDDESLQRAVSLQQLQLAAIQAVEEWTSVLREIPLLARMKEQERQTPMGPAGDDEDDRQRTAPTRSPPPQKPLQLTHITKDATTGQIQIHRDTARETVFRRGWNQPTMSLEELAEREVADAMQRAERQQVAEAAAATAPRRYEALVRDGLEDDVDLVDASAKLDQHWDDWKDANPRGSGNKRGDVGDRNF
jgi:hypothetical protein